MVACSVSIFIFAILNPLDIWDMLGYAASVHSLNGVEISELHATVYADIKAHVTATAYLDLTSSDSYRMTMALDPEAFSQQIPFYKIRLLFILLLDALTKVGLGMFESMHFISAGFGSAGLLLVYLGLRNHVHSLLWVIMPLVLFGLTNDLQLLQQGGVDTFTFFWVALTVICYVRGSKVLLPILALSVLVRTDLILHVALMFAVLLLRNKSNRKQIVIWGIASMAMYFTVNTWAGNFGWFALIHFVFVSDLLATHPAVYSQVSSFNLHDYIGFLVSPRGWISKWLWLSIGCASVSFFSYLWYRKTATTQSLVHAFLAMQRLNVVCLICVAYVVLHYIFFPAVFMRFFVGSCFFMFVSMLSTLSYIYRVEILLPDNIKQCQPACQAQSFLR